MANHSFLPYHHIVLLIITGSSSYLITSTATAGALRCPCPHSSSATRLLSYLFSRASRPSSQTRFASVDLQGKHAEQSG